jgi:hypothetical protein
MLGNVEMPRLLAAMTYGDPAAELPASEVPSTMATSFGSLAEMTMPMQRADPTKKRKNRKYMLLKAFLIVYRGFLASPAMAEMDSGPTTTNAAL